MDEQKINQIKQRYKTMDPFLNERTRRLFVANEAMAVGHGGITLLSEITDLTRITITLGCKELQEENSLSDKRLRKEGGGRKRIIDKDPTI
jgi:hypothetical protein